MPLVPPQRKSGFASLTRLAIGAVVAVAELVLEMQHLGEAALLQHLARADRDGVHRRKLAGDDGDRLRRLGQLRRRIEDVVRPDVLRVERRARGLELHVVLGELRDAERCVQQHLVVALGHAHRGEDRGRRIGALDQVDVVRGDELLVERARQLGLRLVVAQHPLHRAAEQAAALVQVLDADLGGHLVDDRERGERPGERTACCRCGSACPGAQHRGNAGGKSAPPAARARRRVDFHACSSSGCECILSIRQCIVNYPMAKKPTTPRHPVDRYRHSAARGSRASRAARSP